MNGDWRQPRRGVTWFTAFLCLLGCAYYYFFFYNRALVELEIEVDQKTDFKIYWAAQNQQFSEDRSAGVTVDPGQSGYSFFLTDLGRVERFRIDPIKYVGAARLKRLTLSQSGFETILVDFSSIVPLNHIGASEVTPEGLVVAATGVDPHYLFKPDIRTAPLHVLLELARYIAICALILIVVYGCAPLRVNFGFVPVLLAIVLALVVVMAAVSKQNAHPDEYVHLEAAAYYKDNLLPPQIEDQAIYQTYSAYGISRLNNGEIYYLLAGKFARLLEALHISPLLALRGFNILLFGLIFVYASRSVEARLMALPFLISPEVWYIFSYCVSDAFGLFLCFLAGCELVRENSFFNRLLDGNRPVPVTAVIFTSLLLGLLFLLKINYDPFIILIYAVIVWRLLISAETRRVIATRVVVCSVLALLAAGLRIGADYYVNGADRSEKLLAMQEETANHWYKPSTELHKKHISMYMKSRGTSLKEMLVQHRWFAHTFETGFGKYGYFTISASKTYYTLMKWFVVLFIVYICVAVAIKGDTEGRLLALLVVGLSMALVAASIHRSWTVDFQAQGRYLFPILPMIGVILAKNRQAIDTRLFTLLTVQVFLLSVYSFIFIALVAIPRG
jgi:hypothetical protein